MPGPVICVDEHLVVGDDGFLELAPWAVPRNLVDVKAVSGGDGALASTTSLPGKLLIEQKLSWRNNTPVDHMVVIRVTRAPKFIIVSNPNAIQFRDRWSSAIDADTTDPVVSGIFNSQCGLSGDVGTNSVAEPGPGKFWGWFSAATADEWVGPVHPKSTINVWYKMYVWTPPPWSDNSNKNSPQHVANAGWARIQLLGLPRQGSLVTG